MKQIAAAQPDINVTPLIDVLLVLLIIFMVAAPAVSSREETNKTRHTHDRVLCKRAE